MFWGHNRARTRHAAHRVLTISPGIPGTVKSYRSNQTKRRRRRREQKNVSLRKSAKFQLITVKCAVHNSSCVHVCLSRLPRCYNQSSSCHSVRMTMMRWWHVHVITRQESIHFVSTVGAIVGQPFIIWKWWILCKKVHKRTQSKSINFRSVSSFSFCCCSVCHTMNAINETIRPTQPDD